MKVRTHQGPGVAPQTEPVYTHASYIKKQILLATLEESIYGNDKNEYDYEYRFAEYEYGNPTRAYYAKHCFARGVY